MNVLVNYADATYEQAQRFNSFMGRLCGRFDMILSYSPADIDEEFKKNNELFFTVGNPQIGKYGLWRPYILNDAINKCEEGDCICYCDSGAFFIKNFKHLRNFMNTRKIDFMCFDQPFLEYQWTKRDVFLYFGCDEKKYVESNQRLSGYFCFIVNQKTRAFFQDFLKAAKDAPYLFSDSENKMNKPNYDGFIQNRHNQSVFSILTKKYNFESYRDISEIGNRPEMYSGVENAIFRPIKHPESTYPQMVILHRMGRFKISSFIYLIMRLVFPTKVYFKVMDIISDRRG